MLKVKAVLIVLFVIGIALFSIAILPIGLHLYRYGGISSAIAAIWTLDFNNSEKIKSFYYIVAALTAISVGYSGLILGYLYYEHKLESDKNTEKEKRRLNRVEFVLKELHTLDEKIAMIVNNLCSSAQNFVAVKNSISKCIDNINDLLELNFSHLYFSDEDVTETLKFNSLVENEISRLPQSVDDHKGYDFKPFNEKYLEQFRVVRQRCIKNIENPKTPAKNGK